MRIVVFGANGPTGRLLTRAAVGAGHETVAVTRRPDAFPFGGDRLEIAGGDVLDRDRVDQLVAGADAVLSALGVPYGKAPIEVYSRGAGHILDAMKRHEVARLVVVSSGAVTGQDEPTGGVLFNRVLQPYLTKRLGRTLYDDMRRMEVLVAGSDVDWTILRPSGLFELPAVTRYSLTQEHGPGRFTARIDLADAMLRQVHETAFVRRIGHVITTEANPSLLTLLLREALPK